MKRYLSNINWTTPSFQQKASAWASLLLWGIAVWLIIQLAWSVITPAQNMIPVSLYTSSNSTNSSSTSIPSLSPLFESNLFGRYNVQAQVTQPTVSDEPIKKTKLNVKLLGLMYSSDQTHAAAIVQSRGKEGTYWVGEQIAGTSARLIQVTPSHIVLRYQGQNEVLLFSGDPLPNKNKPITKGSNSGPSRALVSQLRSDPASIIDYVQISPVRRNGHISGYRLNPGKKPDLFRQVGLRPGDLAVNINGQDLTDPAQAAAVMNQLFRSDLNQLNITVERNGQLYDYPISLAP